MRRSESNVMLFPEPDSPTSPQHFTAVQVEAHVVDRAHHAAARLNLRAQATDGEERMVLPVRTGGRSDARTIGRRAEPVSGLCHERPILNTILSFLHTGVQTL